MGLAAPSEGVGTNGTMNCPMGLYRPCSLMTRRTMLACALLRCWTDWQAGLLTAICASSCPITYGTTKFPRYAPEWVGAMDGDFRGRFEGADRRARERRGRSRWWRSRGPGPEMRNSPGSSPTGLDVDSIRRIYGHFHGRIAVPSFELGGHWLTNDFRGFIRDGGPRSDLGRMQGSLRVNGRPAVKLSDNPTKAVGPRRGGSATGGYLRSSSKPPATGSRLSSAFPSSAGPVLLPVRSFNPGG